MTSGMEEAFLDGQNNIKKSTFVMTTTMKKDRRVEISH
jgi:hypothetical protein